MTKRILLDIDDTLVSFSDMFCERWNRYVSSLNNDYKKFKVSIDDITEYDLMTSLNNFYLSKNISTITLRPYFLNCMQQICDDRDFYKNPYYTLEYERIIKYLSNLKEDCKIVLYTKVLSYDMIISKCNFLNENKVLNSLIDEVIFQYEKNKQEPKSYNYDIIIDDAPHNIKYFLENNPNGKVLMPLRQFNKHCLEWSKRIEII